MSKMYLVCAVAVLAMAAQVSLAANDWTNAMGNNNWNDPGNWLNGIPIMEPVGSTGMAMINKSGVDKCVISSAPQGICQWLMIGDGGGTRGELDVINGATIGTPNWGPGETYMGRFNGVGIMNISGTGSIVQSEGWRIGTASTQSYSIVNISNGGMADGIWWDNYVNANGKVQIYTGGTFRTRGVSAFVVNGLIDIQGGLLALESDRTALIEALVETGKIVAYGGAGTVNVSFDGAFTNVTAVPEPMTIALLGLGGLFLRRRIA